MARYLIGESVGARVNSDNTTAVIVALNSGIENLHGASLQPGPEVGQPQAPDPFANFAESNF